MSKLGQRTPVNPDSILGRYVALCHTPRPLQPASGPPGNPEATPECDAVHDCDWIVYRCNYPADFDGGVAL